MKTTTQPFIEWSLSTSSGFPPVLPGIGRFRKAVLDRCDVCSDLTSFAYGVLPLCCRHARERFDGIKAGYCQICTREQRCLGVIPASLAHADGFTLDCGHTMEVPPTVPVAFRTKADGTDVLYTDLNTLATMPVLEVSHEGDAR